MINEAVYTALRRRGVGRVDRQASFEAWARTTQMGPLELGRFHRSGHLSGHYDVFA